MKKISYKKLFDEWYDAGYGIMNDYTGDFSTYCSVRRIAYRAYKRGLHDAKLKSNKKEQ